MAEPPHRGRLQAQGGGTEKSITWAQQEPPTADEGLRMLDALWAQLTPAEQRARQKAYAKARTWIEEAGKAGGVNAPVSKSFLEPGSKDIRIDMEVIKGRAFVPSA